MESMTPKDYRVLKISKKFLLESDCAYGEKSMGPHREQEDDRTDVEFQDHIPPSRVDGTNSMESAIPIDESCKLTLPEIGVVENADDDNVCKLLERKADELNAMAMDAKLACKKAHIELESLELLNRELELQIKQMEARLLTRGTLKFQSQPGEEDEILEDHLRKVGRKHHVRRRRQRITGMKLGNSVEPSPIADTHSRIQRDEIEGTVAERPETMIEHHEHEIKLTNLRPSSCDSFIKKHHRYKSRKKMGQSSKSHRCTETFTLELKVGSMKEIHESTICPWYTPDIPHTDTSSANLGELTREHHHSVEDVCQSKPGIQVSKNNSLEGIQGIQK